MNRKKDSCRLNNAPLAARMRPRILDDFVGQEHILSEGKLLHRLIKADKIISFIFFGPPGTGKTSLGAIIANSTNAYFERVNAVSSSVAEIRKLIGSARVRTSQEARKTIIFIDELHRFNKAQQDILMPSVEEGEICLIGATVHNPAFSIISPLLSRSHVFEFKALGPENIETILRNALKDRENGLGKINVELSGDAIEYIVGVSEGDARRALNILEISVLSCPEDDKRGICIDRETAVESSQKKIVLYDKTEDGHYDTISAFIKSMRGSDPDAAVYWLAKMLQAGEDPLFIARRILIFASEDVGNADPHALMVASSAFYAVSVVGLPEARISLAQAVTYAASAPKSNASYKAIEAAIKDIRDDRIEEIPQHLKNKHYYGEKVEKGKEYKYSHSYKDAFVVQEYLPSDKRYYFPSERGYEKNIKTRLGEWRKQRSEKRS